MQHSPPAQQLDEIYLQDPRRVVTVVDGMMRGAECKTASELQEKLQAVLPTGYTLREYWGRAVTSEIQRRIDCAG